MDDVYIMLGEDNYVAFEDLEIQIVQETSRNIKQLNQCDHKTKNSTKSYKCVVYSYVDEICLIVKKAKD